MNPIHIKLEYPEAVDSKKNALNSEINLLKISKTIKNYSLLRKKEQNKKLKILKLIKETKTELGKIQKNLPKVEIPEILQEHENAEEIKIKEKNNKDLESQLQDIREKLKSLQE